jgi:hypothetical protein
MSILGWFTLAPRYLRGGVKKPTEMNLFADNINFQSTLPIDPHLSTGVPGLFAD